MACPVGFHRRQVVAVPAGGLPLGVKWNLATFVPLTRWAGAHTGWRQTWNRLVHVMLGGDLGGSLTWGVVHPGLEPGEIRFGGGA